MLCYLCHLQQILKGVFAENKISILRQNCTSLFYIDLMIQHGYDALDYLRFTLFESSCNFPSSPPDLFISLCFSTHNHEWNCCNKRKCTTLFERMFLHFTFTGLSLTDLHFAFWLPKMHIDAIFSSLRRGRQAGTKNIYLNSTCLPARHILSPLIGSECQAQF